jgi:hypothetical protein
MRNGKRTKRAAIVISVYQWVGLLSVTMLVAGCGGGQAAVKYPSANQSIPAGQTTAWQFDADPAGGLPPGAAAFSGTWAVRAEADAPSPPNALCQTGTAEFPALTLSDAVYADVVVATRFKPISGRSDQAAGIIFRVQDQDNYYILRANALEGNVNLYTYTGGTRSALKEGTAQVAAGQWQELRVEALGHQLRGFLNGQLVVQATDTTYPAGRVGLWTKADSVTCFDNVQATAK